METKDLELYESPTSEVVELKTEGMICESGARNGYGDAGEDEQWY